MHHYGLHIVMTCSLCHSKEICGVVGSTGTSGSGIGLELSELRWDFDSMGVTKREDGRSSWNRRLA